MMVDDLENKSLIASGGECRSMVDSAHYTFAITESAHSITRRTGSAHNMLAITESAHSITPRTDSAHNILALTESAHSITPSTGSAHNMVTCRESTQNMLPIIQSSSTGSVHSLIPSNLSEHNIVPDTKVTHKPSLSSLSNSMPFSSRKSNEQNGIHIVPDRPASLLHVKSILECENAPVETGRESCRPTLSPGDQSLNSNPPGTDWVTTRQPKVNCNVVNHRDLCVRPGTPFHPARKHRILQHVHSSARTSLGQDKLIGLLNGLDVSHQDPEVRGQIFFGSNRVEMQANIPEISNKRATTLHSRNVKTRPHLISALAPSKEANIFLGGDSSSTSVHSADFPFKNLRNIDTVKHSPIKELKEKKVPTAKAKTLQYTSDILEDYTKDSANSTAIYTAVDKVTMIDMMNRTDNGIPQNNTTDSLFAPRFKPYEDRHGRTFLSDNDIDDDEDADLEPDNVMTDIEGIAPPRLIVVKKTQRTILMDSVSNGTSEVGTAVTQYEISCGNSKDLCEPFILPTSKRTQLLKGTCSEEQKMKACKVNLNISGEDVRRRGGMKNDSRKRYIALNSLRRKANNFILQAELRKRKYRPELQKSDLTPQIIMSKI